MIPWALASKLADAAVDLIFDPNAEQRTAAGHIVLAGKNLLQALGLRKDDASRMLR